MERKTVRLALEILKNNEIKIIKVKDITEEDVQVFFSLLAVCQRAVADGFPLQDYFLEEISSITDEYMIIYFANKYEYGTGENYNPKAREIIFRVSYGNLKGFVAEPCRQCNDGKGIYIDEGKNCFDAVYEIGG